jgi:hypothetical protein
MYDQPCSTVSELRYLPGSRPTFPWSLTWTNIVEYQRPMGLTTPVNLSDIRMACPELVENHAHETRVGDVYARKHRDSTCYQAYGVVQ